MVVCTDPTVGDIVVVVWEVMVEGTVEEDMVDMDGMDVEVTEEEWEEATATTVEWEVEWEWATVEEAMEATAVATEEEAEATVDTVVATEVVEAMAVWDMEADMVLATPT